MRELFSGNENGPGSMAHFRPAFFVIALWLFVGLQVFHKTRAYLPLQDLIPYQRNACALVNHFRIPSEGDVSSFGAINPPGSSFGFVPGALLFPRDPYLGEKLGSFLMFGLTLWGLAALLKRFRSGLLMMVTLTWFTVTVDGWFYASSLWPRAHPAFAVWFLYFLARWCLDRDPGAPGIAVLIWIAGMYWFMEIAPLIFVVPVCFLLFRPPLDLKKLTVCVSLGLVLWSPYLIFEARRGGVDIWRNVVVRHAPKSADKLFDEVKANPDLKVIAARPAGWTPNWRLEAASVRTCAKPKGRYIKDPDLGWVWSDFAVVAGPGGQGQYINLLDRDKKWSFQRKQDGAFFVRDGNKWRRREIGHFIETGQPIPDEQMKRPWSRSFDCLLRHSLMRNFDNRFGRLTAFILGIGLGLGLVSIDVLRRRMLHLLDASSKSHRLAAWYVFVGLGTVALLLFTGGVASEAAWLLAGLWGAAVLAVFISWHREKTDSADGYDREMTDTVAIITASFLLCFMLNVLTIPRIEWSLSSRRFFWLTCLLGASLFCATWVWLGGIRRFGKPIFIALSLALIASSAQSSGFFHRTAVMFKPAHQAECYEVLDFLKKDCAADGVTKVSIGYDISFPKWVLVFHHYMSEYKIGGDFDFVLEHRYGIRNTDRSAVGISSHDRYRIVELVRWPPPWNWPCYFDLSKYPRMKIIKRWSKYALLKSVAKPGAASGKHGAHDGRF